MGAPESPFSGVWDEELAPAGFCLSRLCGRVCSTAMAPREERWADGAFQVSVNSRAECTFCVVSEHEHPLFSMRSHRGLPLDFWAGSLGSPHSGDMMGCWHW